VPDRLPGERADRCLSTLKEEGASGRDADTSAGNPPIVCSLRNLGDLDGIFPNCAIPLTPSQGGFASGYHALRFSARGESAPQVYVPPMFADFRAGRDAALDAILTHLFKGARNRQEATSPLLTRSPQASG
jgi:hypothetical protein